MKFLITGVNGQVGHDIMKILPGRGHQGMGSGTSAAYKGVADNVASMQYTQLDVCDAENVQQVMKSYRPDVVIHCAAWTNVESAEVESNHAKVYSTNVEGTGNVAQVCREFGCKMLYVSSDYVFSGCGNKPYTTDEVSFAPLNFYGKSKLSGEVAVRSRLEKAFIVRSSGIFGLNGNNFVKKILNAGMKSGEVYVVSDQIGAPTYSLDLARLLVDIAETEKYGIYHATNEGGFVSRYDFACEIYKQAGVEVTVYPVSTSAYIGTKAERPLNCRLDTSKLAECGFTPLPHWKNALQRFLCEIAACKHSDKSVKSR